MYQGSSKKDVRTRREGLANADATVYIFACKRPKYPDEEGGLEFIKFCKSPLKMAPYLMSRPRLLKICSGLGLCGKNDYELVQGNCSLKRQNAFYTRVLDMLAVNMDTPRDTSLSDDKLVISSSFR